MFDEMIVHLICLHGITNAKVKTTLHMHEADGRGERISVSHKQMQEEKDQSIIINHLIPETDTCTERIRIYYATVNVMPQGGEDGQLGNLTQNKILYLKAHYRAWLDVRIPHFRQGSCLLQLQTLMSEFFKVNKVMSESQGVEKCLSYNPQSCPSSSPWGIILTCYITLGNVPCSYNIPCDTHVIHVWWFWCITLCNPYTCNIYM